MAFAVANTLAALGVQPALDPIAAGAGGHESRARIVCDGLYGKKSAGVYSHLALQIFNRYISIGEMCRAVFSSIRWK